MTEYIIKTDKEVVNDICTFYDVLKTVDIEEQKHGNYSELFMMFDVRIEVFAFYVNDSVRKTCENCIVSDYRNAFLIHFVSYLVTAYYQYNYYASMKALEEMKDYYVEHLTYLLDDKAF